MPKVDLPSTDDILLGKYNRYTFLYSKIGKTSAENTELAGLQTDLANYLTTATEWNIAVNSQLNMKRSRLMGGMV